MIRVIWMTVGGRPLRCARRAPVRMGENKAPQGHRGAFLSPVCAGALRAQHSGRLPTVIQIILIILWIILLAFHPYCRERPTRATRLRPPRRERPKMGITGPDKRLIILKIVQKIHGPAAEAVHPTGRVRNLGIQIQAPETKTSAPETLIS